MSTRGNVIIRSPEQRLLFSYEIRNSAFPEEFIPNLIRYDGRAESLSDLGLIPGQVGNFEYWYEINLEDKSLKVWKSKTYWQHVPDTWKERGYQGCYLNPEKGKGWGYTNWRKGRLINNETLTYAPEEITLESDNRYTKADLEKWEDDDYLYLRYYMKKLKYDPVSIHTWLLPCDEIYQVFYRSSFEDMALLMGSNYQEEQIIARWRLQIGK